MDYDVEYLGNKMSSLLHLRDFYLPSISLQIGNISLPIFGQCLSIKSHVDVNATELIQCVTMDGRCTLLDSMYDQYVKIMQDYNTSCLAIQSQYQFCCVVPIPSRAVKQSVANYQLAVAGVLAEVQYLYYRIEQVSDLLKHIGVDLGELPSLALPSLSLPPLAIDWQMPRPSSFLSFTLSPRGHLRQTRRSPLRCFCPSRFRRQRVASTRTACHRSHSLRRQLVRRVVRGLPTADDQHHPAAPPV